MSVRRIAAKAGVSIATVSRVLNNDPAVRAETRDKVLTVANQVGYMPTTGRRVKTQLGFCYTSEMSLAHRFDATLLEGIVGGADEAGFEVVIVNLLRDRKSNESYTQFFLRKGIRGVILRTNAESRETCKQIAAERFPHVVIAERFEDANVNFIEGDSYPDSVRAVEYLISLGHRRIGFGMHNIADRDHNDRLQGYRDALSRHNVPFQKNYVFEYPWTMSGGATVMEMLMSTKDRPTAIYFADPMLAVGGVKKAVESGVHVPRDISIIGFDDTDVRFSVHPTLTAVCQDAAGLGFEAASWLAGSLEHPGELPLQKRVPTFFEINQSTAPPHGAGK
jgi:DNA-binding LacI/PurR family transcriptional regulator